MSRLERRLLNHLGRAISDYELIAPGDRLLVAVSGGKDSLALLELLRVLQGRSPVPFSLVALNLDMGQPGFPAEVLEAHFASLGIEYRMVRQEIWPVIQRLTPEGKTPCSVCARLRRGVLYSQAVELGCDAIALGHHREDLAETLLLSALFSGALKSMPPKLSSDDGRNVVIRPLVYCPEEELRQYARERALPVIPCSTCCASTNQQRRNVKQLLAGLAKEHPAVPGNLLNALKNVVPSHLLDRSLWASGFAPGSEKEGRGRAVAREIVALPLRTATLSPARHTNAYLVGRRELLLVDPGSDEPAELRRLRGVLARLRQRGRRAKAIILTHHHADHTRGAAALAEAEGLPIWAHAECLARRPELARFEQRALRDAERLTLDGEPATELQVLETPGHTKGHLSLFLPESRALICGDLFSSLSTIAIAPPEGEMDRYLTSLERAIALTPEWLYPGHGSPVREGAARLRELVTHRSARADQILRALEEGPAPLEQIAACVYGALAPEYQSAAAGSTLAQLLAFEREGKVAREGVLFCAMARGGETE